MSNILESFTVIDQNGKQFRIEPRSSDLPIYYVTDKYGTTSEFYYIEKDERWKLNRTIDAISHKEPLDVTEIGELITKHVTSYR